MRSLFVVLLYPVFGDLTDFGQLLEQVTVEYFSAIGSVKSFDKGVLGGLAGLDELQVDLMFFCPVGKRQGNELGAVVHSQAFWVAPIYCYSIDGPDNTGGRQIQIHLNGQRLPVVIIKDVKGSEPTTAHQCVAHEVD